MRGTRKSRRGMGLPPAGEHTVQFYSRNQFLLESAVAFLAPVLKQGQGTIVLASRDHHREMAHRLKAAGIDLDHARSCGRYIELDTDEFLSLVMINGRPHAERFARMMGPLVIQASRAAKGQPAIFGEAVSVLGSRGQNEAAIELERLWNDLARRYDFALLCGHAASNFSSPDHSDAFARICAAHSDVRPEESYLELEGEKGRLRYIAQLQQKLRASNAELAECRHSEEALARSEKLAAMGRLAASIAHEINSPLTSLTNIVYLLSANSSLDSAARQYVAMADHELRRTASITKQVLGFYRESPEAVLCKVSAIMNDVLDLYQSKLGKSSIVVDRDYRIEGAIDGYPSEMRQVFANLLDNAIDAIGKHGRIRVRVSTIRDWKHRPRRGVRISIADSGPGISMENRKSIFNPFFTTKGESGTGLGLWLSRGIVKRHGGRMRLRSGTQKDRHGTVFSIFLPGPGRKSELPSKKPLAEPWKTAA